MAKEEQRIVRFHGNVQGVGFRYTANQTARGYDITGYVKNLSDGSVECVAEGQPKEIDAFLEELRGTMSNHIRDVQQQTAPAGGNYQRFGVVH